MFYGTFFPPTVLTMWSVPATAFGFATAFALPFIDFLGAIVAMLGSGDKREIISMMADAVIPAETEEPQSLYLYKSCM